MHHRRYAIASFFLLVAASLASGCVTMTEEQVTASPASLPGQQIKDKDARIKSLQEIIDDQQRQLRELSDRLNECEGRSAGQAREKSAAAGN